MISLQPSCSLDTLLDPWGRESRSTVRAFFVIANVSNALPTGAIAYIERFHRPALINNTKHIIPVHIVNQGSDPL